jgi:hypothetical protein
MLRTMRRRDGMPGPDARLRRLAMLGALVTSVACHGRAPRVQVSDFAPDEHVTRAHGMALVLVRAQDEDAGVVLDFAIDNDAATPITVDRRGILLQVGELEFPVATGSAIAESTAVPAGGRVALQAYFDTGHRLASTATLHLRGLRSGTQWLDAARLPVPAATAAARPGPRE